MSDGLPRIEGRELVRALKKAGFLEIRQRGSHLHLRRDADGRRATVPIHTGRIVPPGTLGAILRDIEMDAAELRKLL
jgi:predicted RNA binding protein YcfA (HicA-like mRNA interferase family)